MTRTDRFIELLVVGLKGVLFKGRVQVVSGENVKGRFDVLPLHSNFITLIRDKIKFVTVSGEEREVKFKKGVMRVKNNQVEVVIDDK